MNEIAKKISSALDWPAEEITVLSRCGDGFTNDNFVFQYRNGKYVYRKSSDSSNILSINRNAEYQAAIEIGKAVKTPGIVYFDFISGDMVTEFIDGRTLDYKELLENETLKIIIDCMKSIHRQKSQYNFDPYDDIIERIEYAKAKNISDFDYETVTGCMHKIRRKLSIDGESYIGLCHNDFFPANFLVKDKDIYVFDFEFSAMGDIFFDLSCLAMVMPEEYYKKILDIYFGNSDDLLVDRLKDSLYISRLWNVSWALVKYADGCMNYDYRQALDYHFNLLLSR